MPKKIKTPIARIMLTFDPSYLRIQRGPIYWYVRARQSSTLGDTWIVIAEVATEREALAIAEQLAVPGDFITDGTNFKRKDWR